MLDRVRNFVTRKDVHVSTNISGTSPNSSAHDTSARIRSFWHDASQKSIKRLRKEPLCLTIGKRIYHKYGLKHLVLILVLLIYTGFGALVFVLIEEPQQTYVRQAWENDVTTNRTVFVKTILHEIFNNTNYLVYITQRSSWMVEHHLRSSMRKYEGILGVQYTEQKIEWDYWNAMLYCGTIFTTIGYGHIYPRTHAGRFLTMIYALVGIPLVLLVLQDMGKLLTVSLKYPWFQFKRGFRRLLRIVTKQSKEEMMVIEHEERENLPIFDLPIPVAVGLVVGWIFVCSATCCIWENWSYLEAFYFFFISLSTIGLGDLTPSKPRMLLMMFGYIVVGLSLVSMLVNLIQIYLEKHYEAGRDGDSFIDVYDEESGRQPTPDSAQPHGREKRITLGIFQSSSNLASNK